MARFAVGEELGDGIGDGERLRQASRRHEWDSDSDDTVEKSENKPTDAGG
jgi:hypothetical protein